MDKTWPMTNLVLPLPSIIRTLGRPKKITRRNIDEPQNPIPTGLKRRNIRINHGRCHLWGHNLKTYKGQLVGGNPK